MSAARERREDPPLTGANVKRPIFADSHDVAADPECVGAFAEALRKNQHFAKGELVPWAMGGWVRRADCGAYRKIA